jgi:hypothetical protein
MLLCMEDISTQRCYRYVALGLEPCFLSACFASSSYHLAMYRLSTSSKGPCLGLQDNRPATPEGKTRPPLLNGRDDSPRGLVEPGSELMTITRSYPREISEDYEIKTPRFPTWRLVTSINHAGSSSSSEMKLTLFSRPSSCFYLHASSLRPFIFSHRAQYSRGLRAAPEGQGACRRAGFPCWVVATPDIVLRRLVRRYIALVVPLLGAIAVFSSLGKKYGRRLSNTCLEWRTGFSRLACLVFCQPASFFFVGCKDAIEVSRVLWSFRGW